MKKDLVDMNGGRAVVLELPLLAIIGAEGATFLELTTDGNRLILSPPRTGQFGGAEPAPGPVPTREANSVVAGLDPENPKETIRLIHVLQAQHGFTQEHFRRLHHFGPKASLPTHSAYCSGTGRFRAVTNVIVAQRLASCMQTREAGGSWDEAIERARREFPFPRGQGVT